MDKAVKIAFCCLALAWANRVFAAPNDIYVVVYATHDGKTGHVGIAVDKYQILVRDCAKCPGKVKYDTVRTGELLYFDMWPAKDRFNKERLFEDIPAAYFRLPASSAEKPITVATLLRSGIPHEEGFACDGLLRFKTDFRSDQSLIQFLDRQIAQNRQFNAMRYNCADFVEAALEFLFKVDIRADESIFLNDATTPNRLYAALKSQPGCAVLKDAGQRAGGTFLEERIIKW